MLGCIEEETMRTADRCPLPWCGELYHFRRGGWADDARNHLANVHPNLPQEWKLRAARRMRPRSFSAETGRRRTAPSASASHTVTRASRTLDVEGRDEAEATYVDGHCWSGGSYLCRIQGLAAAA